MNREHLFQGDFGLLRLVEDETAPILSRGQIIGKQIDEWEKGNQIKELRVHPQTLNNIQAQESKEDREFRKYLNTINSLEKWAMEACSPGGDIDVDDLIKKIRQLRRRGKLR